MRTVGRSPGSTACQISILRTPAVVSAVLVSLSVAGCGQESRWQRLPVSGTVTLDGEPLAGGTITFVPLKGAAGPKARTSVVDGSFEFDADRGPVAGTMRVEIHSAGVDVEEFEQMIRSGQRPVTRRIAIPKDFNDYSQLRVQVATDGANQFEFNLNTENVAADDR